MDGEKETENSMLSAQLDDDADDGDDVTAAADDDDDESL